MTAFPLIELIWIYIGIKLNELMKCSLQCLQQSSYSTFLYQHHNLHKFAWKWASNIDYQITHQNAFNHSPVETRPTNQYKEYQRNRLKNIHLKNIHQNFIWKNSNENLNTHRLNFNVAMGLDKTRWLDQFSIRNKVRSFFNKVLVLHCSIYQWFFCNESNKLLERNGGAAGERWTSDGG